MRNDRSFLKDILSACGRIQSIVLDTDPDTFFTNETMPAAVLHYLTVVGEAINRLSSELKERHPQVEWRHAIAVRNRIVHAYFDLEWRILWNTATANIPALRLQVEEILAKEFPPSGKDA